MLSLSNVTFIALTDYKLDEHKAIVDKVCKDIEWGAVKIIYDKGINHDVNEWNKRVIYDLWKYVDTEFAFLFHADGYPIHPELWNPDWLQYDYIGAPWPLPTDDYSFRDEEGNLVRMGNSVGLRSRKLMKLPTDLGLEWRSYYGNTHEDGFLTCHHRKLFESHGIKFAPLEVAVHFSKEHEIPENKGLETFCFHQV